MPSDKKKRVKKASTEKVKAASKPPAAEGTASKMSTLAEKMRRSETSLYWELHIPEGVCVKTEAAKPGESGTKIILQTNAAAAATGVKFISETNCCSVTAPGGAKLRQFQLTNEMTAEPVKRVKPVFPDPPARLPDPPAECE